MVTNLEEVRRLGEAKAEENLEFRRYLKDHHRPEHPFRVLAAEIQRQIDCTTCANCCRYSVVSVTRADVEAIARYLVMETEEVIRQYMTPDPDCRTGYLLRSTKDGCVFLDGNLCTVYDARPQVCREFPYAGTEKRTLGGRVSSLCRWAPLCPIIFNTFEEYKHRVGFHPHGATPHNPPKPE